MPLGLQAYRAATTLLGVAAPALRLFGTPGSAWRCALTGASEDLSRAAGSVWIHASSMGETVAARAWVQTLLGAGHRAPLLLTTRTARGLLRARRELGERVVARIAPADLPQLVRSFLACAAPWRLDVVETEIWPHLVLESRRRGVGVVFVSATVSERSRGRLLRLGAAGPRLLGEGVWVLAQSDRHAERFRSLGVPGERIRVTGDLKAEAPLATASRDPAARPAIVFGSLRPGEEAAAAAVARLLADRPEGPALIIAPRHRAGFERVRATLTAAGMKPLARTEADRAREDLAAWLERVTNAPAPRLGILFTQGELPAAYESAGIAIVGGTFAPFGGHNVLEPAARGCAVIVGPHHDAIEPGVTALEREGGLLVAADPALAADRARSLLESPERMRLMGQGAIRAAGSASQAAARSLEAVARFGLAP